jgi:hypothetical protein
LHLLRFAPVAKLCEGQLCTAFKWMLNVSLLQSVRVLFCSALLEKWGLRKKYFQNPYRRAIKETGILQNLISRASCFWWAKRTIFNSMINVPLVQSVRVLFCSALLEKWGLRKNNFQNPNRRAIKETDILQNCLSRTYALLMGKIKGWFLIQW